MSTIAAKTRRRKKVGIRDIARAAQVSMAAVSMALADHPRISLPTKQRVWKCSAELGYRPRLHRPATAAGGSGCRALEHVGFLLVGESLDGTGVRNLVRTLMSDTDGAGIDLQLAATGNDIDRSGAPDRALAMARKTDGLLLTGFVDRVLLTALQGAGVPHVVLGHTMDPSLESRTHVVCHNDVEMGRKATESLIRAGHRRIAFVCKTMVKGLCHWQWRIGYAGAMAEAGLPVDPALICVSGRDDLTGERAAEMVLALPPRERPTAYVFPTVATNIVEAMQRRGMQIAPDTVVMALDSVTIEAYHAESYPHLNCHNAQIATTGLALLQRICEEPRTAPVTINVPFTWSSLPGEGSRR